MAKELIPTDDRGFFVFRVPNGWAIYGSAGPFDAARGQACAPIAVAVTPDSLCGIVADWAHRKADEQAPSPPARR